MKINWKEEMKDNVLTYTASGAIILLIWFFFQRWDSVASFLGKLWSTLSPFIWGFAIAFILVPIRRTAEEKWLKNTKLKPKTKRRAAVAIAFVIFAAVLVLFFSILTPQIISSAKTLVDSMDSYLKTAEDWANGLNANSQYGALLDSIMNSVLNAVKKAVDGSSGLIATLLSYSVSVVKGIGNFFIGMIVAIYLLADQERWKRQLKQVTYSIWSKDHADYLTYVGRLTIRMLNSFIFGKALDSLIIGIACGIVCGIMQMPYTPLIAFVVGLTNMIPVFGPFLGAIPCIFILLIISPYKAVEFGIFILILQQIDGNILGPRILGDSVGLPALWVMFAIILGGSLFGVLGMFLGVPLFSVIYVLVRDHVNNRLRSKKLRIS
ncbi:AI-2E family transporter [Anaerolactibacter massiliensis]|uniref:AI-2E family transporter n=1 Tax=Anaerolactibacter massiliensis TaxID=2044573 RepID=UPI000CF89198|nr:AI-2E family transporter [Anaerolactibacter massiliensis]